jgi:HlyD family secretion protein
MNMHSQLPNATDAQSFDARLVVDAPTGRRWVRPALIALAVLVAVVAGWYFLLRKPPAPPAVPEIPKVTVVVPGTTMVADQVRVTGSIAARRDMPVGVQGAGGMVTQVLVDAGQYVRAGQVLARVDRVVMEQQVAELAANIKQAEADVAIAQSELDRAKPLVSKGFISQADVDRKTATRDSARARVGVDEATLAAMRARLAQLDVRAPAAGLVLARSVEAGQIVGPGSPALFRIAQDGVLEMRAQVAEQDMARLSVGQSASVRSVGGVVDHAGRIWLLDPLIDATSRQGIARIAVPAAPDLRVGAFANATIGTGQTTKPILPQSAVQVDEKGSFVLLIAPDNTVARRGVTIGSVSSGGLSIASGLNGTERVVSTAAAFLHIGEKVQPVMSATAN